MYIFVPNVYTSEYNSTNKATTYEALTNIETFSMLNRVLHLNFFYEKGDVFRWVLESQQ